MVKTVPFIERRRFPRQSTDAKATAVSGNWWESPSLARLALRDLSSGGLSAHCAVALPLAEMVTVLLPTEPLSNRLTGNRTGRVVRCRRLGEAFHVAVAFDQPPMVAG